MNEQITDWAWMGPMLHFSDSALPVGAYAHSFGLEGMCQDGVVRDVRFQGAGCAISTASASLMTEAVKGKTVEEARSLFEAFHDMMTAGEEEDAEGLGKLAAFSGVRQLPIRIKCATLAWHTLKAALEENDAAESVSTE